LAVATFPWPFGKLSLVVVFLAATLQGNHPWVPKPPRKLISLTFYSWVRLLDGLWRIISLTVFGTQGNSGFWQWRCLWSTLLTAWCSGRLVAQGASICRPTQ
jgi:hypothetical protein